MLKTDSVVISETGCVNRYLQMVHELYGGGIYKYRGNTVEDMSSLMCLLDKFVYHKNLITSPCNKGGELSPKFLRESVVPSTCAGVLPLQSLKC